MEEKIEILYQILIDGLDLTNETLKAYGLTDEKINTLINKKYLQPTKEGIYKLTKIDSFRRYGIRLLLEENDRIKANICFKKCYEMAPNSRDICLQMLDTAVRMRDFEYAFKVFENLEKFHSNRNPVDKANNNLYLYLLSFITRVPEKYIDKVKQIKSEDYMLPNSRCNNFENKKVRRSIRNDNFTYAYTQLNDHVAHIHDYSIRFELIRILLYKTIDRQKQLKKELLAYTKDKQYQKIFSILENIEKYRNLTKYEKRILKITREILNISNGKNLSLPTSDEANNLDEALANNNFDLAFKLNRSFLEKNKITTTEDTIDILLLSLKELTTPHNKENYKFTYSSSNTSPVITNIDNDIKEAEEYVELILNEGLTLSETIKKYGIFNIETILLIKLAYAKKCYESNNESKIEEANYILQEVEIYEEKTEKVLKFLNEVKTYGIKQQKRILG